MLPPEFLGALPRPILGAHGGEVFLGTWEGGGGGGRVTLLGLGFRGSGLEKSSGVFLGNSTGVPLLGRHYES